MDWIRFQMLDALTLQPNPAVERLAFGPFSEALERNDYYEN
jgi:hypothetical protein